MNTELEIFSMKYVIYNKNSGTKCASHWEIAVTVMMYCQVECTCLYIKHDVNMLIIVEKVTIMIFHESL